MYRKNNVNYGFLNDVLILFQYRKNLRPNLSKGFIEALNHLVLKSKNWILPTSDSFPDHVTYDTDGSLQNKKEIEESSKKEAGGDVKHEFSFTWP